MANEWIDYKLGDVTENFDFKRVPVKKPDRSPGPYPYYGASGIVDRVDKYIFDGEYLLIAEDGENLRSRKLPIAFIANGKFWVNNHAHIVRGNGKANTRFLGYVLNKMDISGYLSGSTMPKLTQGSLERIVVRLPPKPVQDTIVELIGSFDDKIELNRRMNRTLEGMAAAIFKSWFIDFDPVHAKAAGRNTGLPKHLADLFPNAFQDSPLGPIPEGWEMGTLADITKLETKSVHPGKQPKTIWEHYSIPAFDEGQQAKKERGETIKSAKYVVPELAVLVSKLNPRFPRIWLPHVNDPTHAICSTEFMPFVPNKRRWRPFIYELMKSQPIQDAIKSHVSGSTGSRQRVKPKEIAVLPVIKPLPRVITAFSELFGPLHDRVLTNRCQNRRLAALRDTLLPKLLSGEIDESVLEQVEVP